MPWDRLVTDQISSQLDVLKESVINYTLTSSRTFCSYIILTCHVLLTLQRQRSDICKAGKARLIWRMCKSPKIL